MAMMMVAMEDADEGSMYRYKASFVARAIRTGVAQV